MIVFNFVCDLYINRIIVYIFVWFLLLNISVLYSTVSIYIIYVSILLLIYIWAVSSFLLLWVSPRPHMQDILSVWYLGVHLGYKVYMFSAILSNARMFSKVTVPVFVSTCNGWKVYIVSHPLQHLMDFSFFQGNDYEIASHCDFHFYFPHCQGVGYRFMCLWAICVFIHSANTVWVPPLCQTLFGFLPLL